MSTKRSFLRPAAIVAALLVALAGCAGEPPEKARPSIAVSVFPLADLVATLMGDDADVHVLLPAGKSPHAFEPSPRSLVRMAEADAVVSVGLGLDRWARPTGDGMQLVMAQLIPELMLAAPTAAGDRPAAQGDAHVHRDHGHDHGHHHAGPDPHLWLDPVATRAFVEALAGRLAEVLPEAAGRIADRRDGLVAELAALDDECRRKLADVPEKRLVTFHDAFDRFAGRYGLTVVAHLTELELAPGGEVKPGRLVAAVEAIRSRGLRVVYTEPQMPPAAADAIAREAGVKVLRLDPVGGPDVPGADGYFALMRSNLATLVQGQSVEKRD